LVGEDEPPVDVGLPEPWLVPEPEADVLLPLALLAPEAPAEVPVVVDEAAASDTEVAGQLTALVLGLWGVAVEPGEALDGLAVPELVESEARRVVQPAAAVELVSVPVPSAPVAAASVLDELETAEAPVEGDMPAPPAVGLCRSLGLAALPAGAPAVTASFGAVETVASTTPTMAWIAGA
jgi:hypothetical protein